MKLSKCLLVFVIGWLAGALFVVTILSIVENESTSRSPKRSHHHNLKVAQESQSSITAVRGAVQNVQRTSLKLISALEPKFPFHPIHHTPSEPESKLIVPLEQKLPHFERNVTDEATVQLGDDEDIGTFIILDWPVDDRLFTLENYKALESILSTYPQGSIRCLIAAANDAYTHKQGNMLSVMHFVKYKRRGYDIEVIPVGKKIHLSETKHDYSSRWLHKCCASCNQVN